MGIEWGGTREELFRELLGDLRCRTVWAIRKRCESESRVTVLYNYRVTVAQDDGLSLRYACLRDSESHLSRHMIGIKNTSITSSLCAMQRKVPKSYQQCHQPLQRLIHPLEACAPSPSLRSHPPSK